MQPILTAQQVALARTLAALINKARGNRQALAAYFYVAYRNGLATVLNTKFHLNGYHVGSYDNDAPVVSFEQKLQHVTA